jgi:hypothetical protein
MNPRKLIAVAIILVISLAAASSGQFTGKRVDQLTELTSPDVDDVFYVEHDPAVAKLHQKLSWGTLFNFFQQIEGDLTRLIDPDNTDRLAIKGDLHLDHVIDVRDSGAIPDDGLDDAPAIQAAIDAAPAGSTILVPVGVYMIGTPLVPATGKNIVGAGRGTVFKATTANTDAIFKWVTLQFSHFANFTCRSDNSTAIAFRGSDLTQYTAYCSFRGIEIYKEMGGGFRLCGGSNLWENVVHGYLGTAGATWQPLYLVGGNASTNIFTNTFINCRYYAAKGVDAACQIETGWNPLFVGCIWEQFAIPAVQAKGVLSIKFQSCNFEHIQPGGSYNCPVILTTDTALTQGSSAAFEDCKFQNNGDTPWDAVVYAGSASYCGFTGSSGSLGAGYYLKKPGPVYDAASTSLVFLKDNHCVNVAAGSGGFTERDQLLLGRTTLLDGAITPPLAMTARAVEPTTPLATDLYLDSGINRYDGVLGLRQYDGTVWHDLGATPTPTYANVSTHTLTLGNACAYTPDGWWKLDDNAASTDVLDSSGNSYTMTAQANTSTLTTAGIVGTGTALTFNGSTDYTKLAAATFTDSSGTISAWVKLTAYPDSTATIFASADEASAAVSKAMLLYVDVAGNLTFKQHTGAALFSVTGNTVLQLNQWYHVAVTSDGAAWALYVNGRIQSLTISGANNGNWFSDTPGRDNIVIGALVQSAVAYYLTGAIDDVRVYSETLTQPQIAYMYTSRAETFGGHVDINGTPGYTMLRSPNGTAWYLFVEDDGTLKVHNAVPTANADGDAVGGQTD